MRKYTTPLTKAVREIHKDTGNTKCTSVLTVVGYRIQMGRIHTTCVTSSSNNEKLNIKITESDLADYIGKAHIFRKYRVFGRPNLTLWVHSYTDGGSIPVTGLSRIECYLNYIALHM